MRKLLVMITAFSMFLFFWIGLAAVLGHKPDSIDICIAIVAACTICAGYGLGAVRLGARAPKH